MSLWQNDRFILQTLIGREVRARDLEPTIVRACQRRARRDNNRGAGVPAATRNTVSWAANRANTASERRHEVRR